MFDYEAKRWPQFYMVIFALSIGFLMCLLFGTAASISIIYKGKNTLFIILAFSVLGFCGLLYGTVLVFSLRVRESFLSYRSYTMSKIEIKWDEITALEFSEEKAQSRGLQVLTSDKKHTVYPGYGVSVQDILRHVPENVMRSECLLQRDNNDITHDKTHIKHSATFVSSNAANYFVCGLVMWESFMGLNSLNLFPVGFIIMQTFFIGSSLGGIFLYRFRAKNHSIELKEDKIAIHDGFTEKPIMISEVEFITLRGYASSSWNDLIIVEKNWQGRHKLPGIAPADLQIADLQTLYGNVCAIKSEKAFISLNSPLVVFSGAMLVFFAMIGLQLLIMFNK